MSSLRERKPHRFTIGNETPIVRVLESARARTKRIIVGPAPAAEVIVPRGTPDADVDALLEEKRGWVERKVSASREIAARPPQLGSSCVECGAHRREGRARRRPDDHAEQQAAACERDGGAVPPRLSGDGDDEQRLVVGEAAARERFA